MQGAKTQYTGIETLVFEIRSDLSGLRKAIIGGACRADDVMVAMEDKTVSHSIMKLFLAARSRWASWLRSWAYLHGLGTYYRGSLEISKAHHT